MNKVLHDPTNNEPVPADAAVAPADTSWLNKIMSGVVLGACAQQGVVPPENVLPLPRHNIR